MHPQQTLSFVFIAILKYDSIDLEGSHLEDDVHLAVIRGKTTRFACKSHTYKPPLAFIPVTYSKKFLQIG